MPEIDLCGDVPTQYVRAVNLRVAAAGALELGLTRPILVLLRRRGPYVACGSRGQLARSNRAELMNHVPWYPLRFEPIYQYRPWGGHRLANVLSMQLPGKESIGEAWLLSDRDEYQSRIADGPLTGRTIADLIRDWPQEILGAPAAHLRRFPLLLKFLDVCDRLSVQVHPTDDQTGLLPQGEPGKTEAWVVLHSGATARIYAGLNPCTTAEALRRSLATRTVTDHLASFTPQTGDAVLLRAGSVHSLRDIVVFEVQQNSDVTFRLDDWDRIDAKTGQRRPLQVAQALASVTFPQGAIAPVPPVVEAVWPVLRERLFRCEHFGVWRLHGASPFPVGRRATARLLVCIEGGGTLVHDGAEFAFRQGEVLLLPAAIGACRCQTPSTVTLLEISLPENPAPWR